MEPIYIMTIMPCFYYDEARLKCLLKAIGRRVSRFVGSSRGIVPPRATRSPKINRHYIDRHESKCKRTIPSSSCGYGRFETDCNFARRKNVPTFNWPSPAG